MDNVRMALKSVDGLLGLVTSLIAFESTDNYTLRLHVSEYELNSYLETTCEAFRTYASIRDIDITRESGFPYLNVRFDKDKMDSILKNILSNALKYTPRGGVSRSVPSRTGMYGVWKWKTRGLAFHLRNGRNCSGTISGAVMPSICKWRKRCRTDDGT